MARVVLSTAWGGKQIVSMGLSLSGHLEQNTSGKRSFPATNSLIAAMSSAGSYSRRTGNEIPSVT